jgi:succinoglycan biosynthesis transport protein ExoP
MVLIDAPPVIHLADARVLGRLADGIVLVIRAGETTSESAMIACQRFAEDGSHVLGTILNSWDPKAKGRYGYSYDYQGAYSE